MADEERLEAYGESIGPPCLWRDETNPWRQQCDDENLLEYLARAPFDEYVGLHRTSWDGQEVVPAHLF